MPNDKQTGPIKFFLACWMLFAAAEFESLFGPNDVRSLPGTSTGTIFLRTTLSIISLQNADGQR